MPRKAFAFRGKGKSQLINRLIGSNKNLAKEIYKLIDVLFDCCDDCGHCSHLRS